MAGTDASVYVNLFGEMGSTGKRHLKENKRDSNKFEQGSVDLFEIQAVDLFEPNKLIVSHDGTGFGKLIPINSNLSHCINLVSTLYQMFAFSYLLFDCFAP